MLVNPLITSAGAELEIDDEGCLARAGARAGRAADRGDARGGRTPPGADVRLELEGLTPASSSTSSTTSTAR